MKTTETFKSKNNLFTVLHNSPLKSAERFLKKERSPNGWEGCTGIQPSEEFPQFTLVLKSVTLGTPTVPAT